MDIHEHQAKELLRDYNIPTPNGKAVFSVDDALLVAKELPGPVYVVKAQIHAGGRGKGGGVKLAKGIDKVEEVVDSILGMDLVTPQTPPEGKRVHQVLIAEDVYYPGPSEPEN